MLGCPLKVLRLPPLSKPTAAKREEKENEQIRQATRGTASKKDGGTDQPIWADESAVTCHTPSAGLRGLANDSKHRNEQEIGKREHFAPMDSGAVNHKAYLIPRFFRRLPGK
jgi:hypothetical protein